MCTDCKNCSVSQYNVFYRSMGGVDRTLTINSSTTVQQSIVEICRETGLPPHAVVLLFICEDDRAVLPLVDLHRPLVEYKIRRNALLIVTYSAPTFISDMKLWPRPVENILKLPENQLPLLGLSSVRAVEKHLEDTRRTVLLHFAPASIRFWRDTVGRCWEVTIYGPRESPYEDGCFKLLILIDKIFHPFVTEDGFLVDIHPMDWSPAFSLGHLILRAIALLSKPGVAICNAQQTHNPLAMRSDWTKLPVDRALEQARDWTRQFARPLSWSAEPDIHCHFPYEFRRTVKCIYMLHRRNARVKEQNKRRRADENPFARLPLVVVKHILRLAAPLTCIPLWKMTQAQLAAVNTRFNV